MDVLGKEQLMNTEKHLGMSLTTKLLRYGGMWPNINDKYYKAYTCIVALNCVLFMTLLSHIYFSDGKDLSAVIENTDHILTVASYIVTMLSILNNRGVYKEIVSSIQSLISYSQSDVDDDRKRAVRKGIYIERKLCKYYLTAISMTASCFLLKPLVTIVLSSQEINLASMDFPLKLVPFTDRTSILKVVFEYLCHCSILGLLIITIVPLDLFTFTLIKYLAKQFEVVSILLNSVGDHKHDRDNVSARSLESSDSLNQKSKYEIGHFGSLNEHHGEDFCSGDVIRGFKIQAGHEICRNRIRNQMRAENDLNMLVKCHQEILENAKKLVRLLSPIIFSHYLVSSLTICLVGYQITTAENKGTLISNCAHLSSFMLRLFVLCYLSSEVYSQSVSVCHAAYSTGWYPLSIDAKRTLSLVMLMAQRPVCMRASQFGVVSLEMFSALVQTAYSYYSVLIKMNST